MSVSLRLMTYNIAHGRGLSLYQGFHGEKRLRKNLGLIGEIIAQSRADVVALQEVDEDSHWNKGLDQLALLQADCGLPHALYGINNRRSGEKHLNYGNGILSRHPIHHWRNNPFGDASLGEKGFLYAELDIAGHHLPLINLHLDYKSRKKRVTQIEQVIAFITDQPPPKGRERLAPIICGDFNSRSQPKQDAVNHLFDHILEHREYRRYPDSGFTFPSHFPSWTIDFVFLPFPYKMTRCEILPDCLSDHRPVLLEFAVE